MRYRWRDIMKVSEWWKGWPIEMLHIWKCMTHTNFYGLCRSAFLAYNWIWQMNKTYQLTIGSEYYEPMVVFCRNHGVGPSKIFKGWGEGGAKRSKRYNMRVLTYQLLHIYERKHVTRRHAQETHMHTYTHAWRHTREEWETYFCNWGKTDGE